jgi:hypothetical protein
MKKKEIIIIILNFIFMASGCVSTTTTDCGSDEPCFAGAVKSCSPATIKTVEKNETFGVLDVKYTISASVKVKKDKFCIVEEKIDDVEMRGNLTEAPGRLIYLFYEIANSPITCEVTDPVNLDMNGILATSGNCTGVMKDLLGQAFAYKGGGAANATAKNIEVVETYCVGDEKMVVYIRNTGSENINLSKEITVMNLSSQSGIPAGWKNFAGTQAITELIPFAIAQLIIESKPINQYSYAVMFQKKSYPVTCYSR